jgi:hypothetical protein
MRCFSWITDALAVGGRFEPEEAVRFAGQDGFTGVIDLRAETCDDAAVLNRHKLAFLHLPTDDCCGVALPRLKAGVRFANGHIDQGGRVLVHCQHGIGRSATLALCVLVARGMEPLAALEIAKAARPVVSPSPAQFESWVAWLHDFKAKSEAPWLAPGFADFVAIAYRNHKVDQSA